MDKIEFFDKITDKNEFLSIAKKRGLKIDSLFEWYAKQYEIILRKAKNNELDAKSYVRIIEESSKKMEKYIIHFKDEEALFDTIRIIDPKNSEDHIRHEKQHLEKIKKYGLTAYFVIIANHKLEDGKLRFRPAVGISDLTELGEKTGWNLKKIIEAEIGIADIENKADEDIRRIEYLRKILSKV